mmetsp:Transcript_42673/g.100112  ORF Transcript_42673/g.100112 Transcript_42673/m.100112 type:complete len:265 (-) Transcript_42673:658-1452(-)
MIYASDPQKARTRKRENRLSANVRSMPAQPQNLQLARQNSRTLRFFGAISVHRTWALGICAHLNFLDLPPTVLTMRNAASSAHRSAQESHDLGQWFSVRHFSTSAPFFLTGIHPPHRPFFANRTHFFISSAQQPIAASNAAPSSSAAGFFSARASRTSSITSRSPMPTVCSALFPTACAGNFVTPEQETSNPAAAARLSRTDRYTAMHKSRYPLFHMKTPAWIVELSSASASPHEVNAMAGGAMEGGRSTMDTERIRATKGPPW